MAFRVRIARATAAVANNYVGKPGQLLYDTTNHLLYMHDGMTVGGHLIGDYDADQVATIALDTIAMQADTVRNSLGLNAAPWAFRNRLHNARMTFWLRGTQFSLTSANPVAYTADRWISHCGDGEATISRTAHAVGAGLPLYYMGHQQTKASSTPPSLSQRIEGVRSLEGKRVYLSVKCSSTVAQAVAAIDVNVYIKQFFGTGGSPSATVEQKVGTFRTKSDRWDEFRLSFDVPSIAGKTIGANGDHYLALRFELPTGVTFGWYVWDLQLEEGLWTPFEVLPYNVDLAICQRFFEIGKAAQEGYIINGINTGYFCSFATTKRVGPQIAFKNIGSSGPLGTPVNAGADVSGFRVRVPGNNSGGFSYILDFEANAEYPL